MKKEKLRKERNKGITLIALVITIIVLLILAGVTIATLTGDNGILTQANKAKTQTEKSAEEEKLKVAIMGSYDEKGELNLEDLKRNLKEQGLTYSGNSFPLTVAVNGTEVKVSKNGDIEEPFNAEEWDKTATPEDCFIWESDTPGDIGYNTIAGYTSSITSYTKVRIPSRCQKIKGQFNGDPEDEDAGRGFFVGVEKVEIPSTVNEIGYLAFGTGMHGLKFSLKEVNIPSSVKTIGTRAFAGCENINHITIPNQVTQIHWGAFESWSSSQTINIEANEVPEGWDSNWNSGCNANIVYAYTGD